MHTVPHRFTWSLIIYVITDSTMLTVSINYKHIKLTSFFTKIHSGTQEGCENLVPSPLNHTCIMWHLLQIKKNTMRMKVRCYCNFANVLKHS